MNPPVAQKIKKELVHLEDVRIDNYYWLNEPDDSKVMDYLVAENQYTEAKLSDVSDLQTILYHEIISRIKQTDESVPYRIRGYKYYERFEQNKEYPLFCRKTDHPEAPEEVLLDVNELAKGTSFCHVIGLNISPDNNFLAYGIDTTSRKMYTIKVKDLTSGKNFDDSIPNTNGIVAWANDNLTIYYTLKNSDTLREEKIFRHKLGSELTQDTLVFFEKDESFVSSVYKTKSEKYILIASTSTLSDEYQFLDADKPDMPFTLIQPRKQYLEYSVDHFEDKFLILTNLEAKNFRLMETPVSNTSINNWKEVLPHRSDVLLESIEIFRKYLVVAERKNATCLLRIIRWEDLQEQYITFDEEVYVAEIDFNPDFKSDQLRFRYSSLTIPTSVYEYNMKDKNRALLKQQEVLGNFDPIEYVSQRLYGVALDGTKIPISLVYCKGLKLDGENPLILYGYGSYGISIDPWFSSVRLSLLDRGFVYAIAHIRGGEELGRQWYEDGKLLKKKNTFTDFITCAEHLIEQKYTNHQKIFAMGGSAGGLLIGAAINLRPDLFKGVIASVPFVDVLTTMLDETIPLTTIEYDEWGNPNQIEYYEYIKSYSPYDNISGSEYPNILVVTGLHDSQVPYWEPAKWVAKLRDLKTDKNLLLLHTNLDAGHGGASGRFEKYKETALEYAFLFKLLNIGF